MANVALGDDFTDCCNFMRKIVNTISKANKPGGKDRRGIGAAGTPGKGEIAGLAAKSYLPKEWNKFSSRQKTHVWTLRGYSPGDIDTRGNLCKGSQKKSGKDGKDSINLSKKQVAMIAQQTACHIAATSAEEEAADDDDDAAGEDIDKQEAGAGDSFAARRKKKKVKVKG
jgi:hypothetical protein